MQKQHLYKATIKWTGNNGTGTDHYHNYERSHQVIIQGKSDILCSSDPAFRGDSASHNPEDLFLSSISSCHMLWYLHLCSVDGIVVTGYEDNATAIMLENPDGSGRFTEVVLNPLVTVTEQGMIERAGLLHKKANEFCFIANSLNFEVKHNPITRLA